MKYGILMHLIKDDVGVAVTDLSAGSEIGVATLEGELVGTLHLVDDILLGHKVAVREIRNGQHILEYGHAIGAATQDIARGQHVHIHNIQTLRWLK